MKAMLAMALYILWAVAGFAVLQLISRVYAKSRPDSVYAGFLTVFHVSFIGAAVLFFIWGIVVG